MNVALTRAKALLVVVGNANLLQEDDHWKVFVQYCQQRGAFKGTPVRPSSGNGSKGERFWKLMHELGRVVLGSQPSYDFDEEQVRAIEDVLLPKE